MFHYISSGKERGNSMALTNHNKLNDWIQEITAMCQPDAVHLCDGSDKEYEGLIKLMVDSGQAIRLNQEKRPGCYLFRSHPSDVARVENRTFIASKSQSDAGPTNNWIDPVNATSIAVAVGAVM